jgi:hypothetical protein
MRNVLTFDTPPPSTKHSISEMGFLPASMIQEVSSTSAWHAFELQSTRGMSTGGEAIVMPARATMTVTENRMLIEAIMPRRL